ncbi:hypothetical protein BBJ28_00009927 [Nothophytophthora sp. Chile5]|nr:hypothetical protein BBJ28_00009927 [Nothophytophthora sp. Chile5]
MAQFLATATKRTPGAGDSTDADVVGLAAADDSVKASVRKNDGSFMATFLALQQQRRYCCRRTGMRGYGGGCYSLRTLGTCSAEKKTAASLKQQTAGPKATTTSEATSSTAAVRDGPMGHKRLAAAESPAKPRKRSRWDVGAAPSAAQGEAVISTSHADAAAPQHETLIRAKQQKQKQELAFLEQRIRSFQQQTLLAGGGSAAVSNTALLLDERRREYERLSALADEQQGCKDTLEEAEVAPIRDGTLEHRKRAREMLGTLETAAVLTAHGDGKHHLGDFLPQAELDKFMRDAKALVTKGQVHALEAEAPVGSERRQTPLDTNAPHRAVAAAASAASGGGGAGLGLQASGELTEDDDEFDQYRKRMMLAYRFRPNPLVGHSAAGLNNPRRPYN